jgi:hypothetical protein
MYVIDLLLKQFSRPTSTSTQSSARLMNAGGHPGEASASTSLASRPNEGTERWNVLLSTNLRDMISQNWKGTQPDVRGRAL